MRAASSEDGLVADSLSFIRMHRRSHGYQSGHSVSRKA